MRRTLPALALLLCAAPLLVWAGDTTTTLTLSASSQQQVANDQLDATLAIQETQDQPAVLADHLNRAGNQAMAVARAYPAVRVSSGQYSSWPEYNKDGQITGWTGKAEVQLHSTDFVQSAELVAQLQKFMLLQGVTFSVSDATRKRVEQQMLPDAIAQMQQTAQVAAGALGKHHVRVKELSIDNGAAPRPMMMMMANKMASPAPEVVTPDWQPGQSQVQMQVTGKLELYP
jgi:predicted secreted protein